MVGIAGSPVGIHGNQAAERWGIAGGAVDVQVMLAACPPTESHPEPSPD